MVQIAQRDLRDGAAVVEAAVNLDGVGVGTANHDECAT